ncbi:MAG TPA: ComEC/Rec2 family competence protein, partial [Mucilaginibacter sp.]|nr:ComEC/Rec2 family competence protein [Mucilaginibacter sp.]
MIAAHKGEIPFVVFLIPFIAGIACGLNFCPNPNTFLLSAFIATVATFICLNVFYGRLNIYKHRWFGGALLHIALFFAGWLCIINCNELNKPDHFSKKQAGYLIVKINNEPKANNGTLRFTAEVQEIVSNSKRSIASGNLLIAIKDSAANTLYYGDELLVPASYRAIEPPANPAEFNYKRYFANQNIHYQQYLFPGQYQVLNRNAGNPFIAYSLTLRRHLVEKFRANMRDPEAIAVASTLILGYKADLSNNVLQAYSKTGTVHVLSVSGAHVALLFILLEFLFGFLNRFKYGRAIKASLIILIIWYYSMLTGFSPAVCRAAVMISMVIIGKTYSRTINTLNILAVSAFFLLLYDPLFIVDVGFQLSYLAVFGLVVLQPIVYKWFDFDNKWADKLWALCSISIAAQVITFPLSAFYFHQFPVYFLISNLFIVIPVAVIMYTGFAYMLLGTIPVLGAALGFILDKTILLMDKGLTYAEYAPFATINRIWITPLEYILLYIIVIAIFYYMYERKVWLLKLALMSL